MDWATSASAMREFAAAAFSEAMAIDRVALSRRVCIAPTLARALLTRLIAESTVEMAAEAAVCEPMSRKIGRAHV